VVPEKKFNWLIFIFMCGIFYLPFYWMQKAKCPICKGISYGPAKADQMG
jgi:hypothetical protein